MVQQFDLKKMMADAHAANARFRDEMMRAIQKGHEAKAIKLLKKDQTFPSPERRYESWLHLAAAYGLVKLCTELLDQGNGYDIKAFDIRKRQPLHWAIKCGHAEVCELLLKRGAPVNARTSLKATPLYMATEMGRSDICRILLAAKANPNMKCHRNKTALIVAATEGDLEMCRALLEAGADVSAINEYRDTPLNEAVFGYQPGRKTRGSIQDRVKIVEIFLEAGVDIETLGPMNETPLHLAAAMSDSSILRVLLHAGANVEAKNGWKQTPLDKAVNKSRTEACRMLLEWGANPRGGTTEDWSDPLKNAQRRGDSEIVALLTAALEKIGMERDISDPSAKQEGSSVPKKKKSGKHL